MKKQFAFFSLLFAFLCIFTSCGKNPATALPSKDGIWTLVENHTTTTSITGFADQVSTGTSASTATFTDNTVIITTNGSSETYNWTYADDKITLTKGSDAMVYDVTSASSKKEVWHRDETSSNTLGTITTSVRVVQDITLTR